MDLEVRHLKLVRAVAALGGLTPAGRALYLSQSALSHQLRDIETRLGTLIFLRVGKRMVLTSAGERLLRSADDILGTLERTEDAIRGLAAGGTERLRVSSGGYTQYHWLPPVLKRFRSVCPNVDVQIVAGAGGDAVALLASGSIDLCIVGHPVEDGRLHVRPLFDDELVAIVEPTHRLASRRFVRAEDFADETLLLDAPLESHAVYHRALAAPGMKFARVQLIAQTSAMLELAGAGLGIGLLARWAAEPWARAGTLRAVPLNGEGASLRWNAIVLKELSQRSYVREFVDAMRAVFTRGGAGSLRCRPNTRESNP